jgi:hypothetical protein
MWKKKKVIRGFKEYMKKLNKASKAVSQHQELKVIQKAWHLWSESFRELHTQNVINARADNLWRTKVVKKYLAQWSRSLHKRQKKQKLNSE